MKKIRKTLMISMLLVSYSVAVAQVVKPQFQPVNFSLVNITDKFWKPKMDKVATATIQACVYQTETATPRIKNFEKVARKQGEKHEGIFYDDSDVFKALEKNNQNTGGSYIEKGPAVLFIRTEGLARSVDDIRNIPVKYLEQGAGVFIRDLADVRIGHATRYGAMLMNDEGEVAGAVVMMLKGENSSEVIKDVKLRIAEIQKSLPEGVIIEPFLDRTKMVDQAIDAS